MDVDEPAAVSIFGLVQSFRAAPSTPSTILATVDTSQLAASRQQLHDLTFDELTQRTTSPAVTSGTIDESGNTSRKAARKPGKDGVCVQLQNTGRFVFASNLEHVSDIYRVMGKDVHATKSNNKAADSDSVPLRKMNELTLSVNEAESGASKTSAAPASSSQKTKLSASQTNRPAVALSSTSQQQQQKPGAVPTTATSKSTMNAGRAAAKARMAAMGEEWPEEEDLPGFSRPNPASAVNASTGTLSRDANKQLNDAMQRQKKNSEVRRYTFVNSHS